MVFQSYVLFPHYNVFDNVAYGLKLRKMDKKVMMSLFPIWMPNFVCP